MAKNKVILGHLSGSAVFLNPDLYDRNEDAF